MHDSTATADFTIERAGQPVDNPSLAAAWNSLLDDSQSPESVFQTPEYFEFINQCPNIGNQQELLLIKDRDTEEIVGVVPLRTGRRTLFLQAGSRTLARLRLQTIVLLGSVPLAPQQSHLWDALVQYLFHSFPDKDTLALQSLPFESHFHHYLRNSPAIQKNYGLYVKDGWRACHTTPLPPCYQAYLAQFKAKKRYNLQRQLKLLEKATGPLQLRRIDAAEHVATLMDQVRAIASPSTADSLMRASNYRELARKQLLLCYTLECGNRVCAIIMGIRHQSTYHVHNILYDQSLAQFSPGSSILHLAIEDLIGQLQVSLVDYGYGSPEQTPSAGNQAAQRGHVFLYKKTLRNRLLFGTYALFSSAVALVKQLQASVPARGGHMAAIASVHALG